MSTMHHILVIDDDQELCDLLREYLLAESFACQCAVTAESGLALAGAERWDMIILDIMLPGKSGLDVLRELRGAPATRDFPVLILTARGEEIDRVLGLELGADDYLAKPFSARELVARIRAVLRRARPAKAPVPETPAAYIAGDLSIWPGSLRVTVGAQKVELSAVELRLLEQLLKTPGTVITREALCQILFGHEARPFDRSLDMLVSRLRKKLGPREDGGERIRAVRGEGYAYLLSGGPA